MQRKQKLTVVAIVMGIGLALAMLFMQPANHLSQAERDSAAKSDSSGFSATPFTTTRRENSAPGGTVSPSTNPSTFKQYSVEPRLSGTIEPLDADGARPTVLDRPSAPTEFTPFRPANQRLVDQQHPSSTQANNDPVRQPTGEYGNQFRAEDPSELEDNRADGGSAAWPHEPVERKHKVVDGDSLTALAQKYLGNPDRAEDLFYYNRDILRSGELLP
ncbi:MAG: hypothetical protein SGJ20_22650, partial [Planctomycetota bacterium]|nr:hypothetical protein [Planctomycetota bacterium]